MPYEGEDPPFVEPDPALNELTEKVIGAAYEVYNELGPGLDEAIYRAAFMREFVRRDIPFQSEVWIDVIYKGELIGRKRIDLLIDSRLVVELKAVEALAPLHRAQLRTYLKIMKLRLGLLINFNAVLLRDGIKRVLNPNAQ